MGRNNKCFPFYKCQNRNGSFPWFKCKFVFTDLWGEERREVQMLKMSTASLNSVKFAEIQAYINFHYFVKLKKKFANYWNVEKYMDILY